VKKFSGEFSTSDGSSLAPKDEPVDAMDEGDEDRESVKVNRKAPSGGGSGDGSADAGSSSSGSSRG
jgi:F-type H+-transporting ATPase subunit alpha